MIVCVRAGAKARRLATARRRGAGPVQTRHPGRLPLCQTLALLVQHNVLIAERRSQLHDLHGLRPRLLSELVQLGQGRVENLDARAHRPRIFDERRWLLHSAHPH
jgi:hypothetical protein